MSSICTAACSSSVNTRYTRGFLVGIGLVEGGYRFKPVVAGALDEESDSFGVDVANTDFGCSDGGVSTAINSRLLTK